MPKTGKSPEKSVLSQTRPWEFFKILLSGSGTVVTEILVFGPVTSSVGSPPYFPLPETSTSHDFRPLFEKSFASYLKDMRQNFFQIMDENRGRGRFEQISKSKPEISGPKLTGARTGNLYGPITGRPVAPENRTKSFPTLVLWGFWSLSRNSRNSRDSRNSPYLGKSSRCDRGSAHAVEVNNSKKGKVEYTGEGSFFDDFFGKVVGFIPRARRVVGELIGLLRRKIRRKKKKSVKTDVDVFYCSLYSWFCVETDRRRCTVAPGVAPSGQLVCLGGLLPLEPSSCETGLSCCSFFFFSSVLSTFFLIWQFGS